MKKEKRDRKMENKHEIQNEEQTPKTGGKSEKATETKRISTNGKAKERLAKIAISAKADEALTEMMRTVNEGFRGGRVNKQELASWLLAHAKAGFKELVEAVRVDHFNELNYLAGVVEDLRKAARVGQNIGSVKELLAPIMDGPGHHDPMKTPKSKSK